MKFEKKEISIGCDSSYAVMDGLLDEQAVQLVFQLIMKDVSLSFSRVNNLHQNIFPSLTANLNNSHIDTNPHLKNLLVHATNEIGFSYNLARAQINVGLFGDIQQIHSDDGFDKTIIYFANPKWKADWLGELLFYNVDDSEVIAAVTPKPGRMVAFDSLVRHRGGTPSRMCGVPRVTLALKFRSNR